MEQRKRVRSGASCLSSSKKKRVDPGSESGQSAAGTGPVKFMFYEKGGWTDYPADACAVLREAYSAGKEMIRLVLSSCVYLVSFARLLQVDADTGYSRSIAWVDESGGLCTPSVPFEGAVKVDKLDKLSTSTASSPSSAAAALSARKATGNGNGADPVGEIGEVVDGGSTVVAGGGSGGGSSGGGGGSFTGLRKVEASEAVHADVKKRFVDGLGMFSGAAEVTGVFEVRYGGAAGVARKEAFERRAELTELVRGTANVQHAWYGCSKDELCRIIQHGFGRPTRDSTFGVGVYLTPEKLSRLSCVGADVDENGEQLLLLCRVILGSSEAVRAGSVQFHPSTEQFDTGVDNLVDPKKLIVWSTHMNTHILPVYVTSFKLPKEWHEIMEASGISREIKPPPAFIKPKGFEKEKAGTAAIPRLFSVLKPELSATDMSVLQSDYVELKNGKLSREEFLKRVRSLAGDQKLRRIQEQVVQSSGMFIQGKLLELASKRSTTMAS